MIEKAVWTWQDGTYYISYHNRKPKNDNILMDFLHIDGKYNKAFQNYSSALQLFILLMICISALKTLIKPKVDEMTVNQRSCICGIPFLPVMGNKVKIPV